MKGLMKFKIQFTHRMGLKPQLCGINIAYEFSFHTFLLFS